MRRLTIIESPFGDGNGGVRDDALPYLRRAMQDSWARGELPFASHLWGPFFLRESIPAERKAGIEAGYEFWEYRRTFIEDDGSNKLRLGGYPLIAFYCDLGISFGMDAALKRAKEVKREFVLRYLDGHNLIKPKEHNHA